MITNNVFIEQKKKHNTLFFTARVISNIPHSIGKKFFNFAKKKLDRNETKKAETLKPHVIYQKKHSKKCPHPKEKVKPGE